jgi:hypothetical protein
MVDSSMWSGPTRATRTVPSTDSTRRAWLSQSTQSIRPAGNVILAAEPCTVNDSWRFKSSRLHSFAIWNAYFGCRRTRRSGRMVS